MSTRRQLLPAGLANLRTVCVFAKYQLCFVCLKQAAQTLIHGLMGEARTVNMLARKAAAYATRRWQHPPATPTRRLNYAAPLLAVPN
jgi:hypothetical protein